MNVARSYVTVLAIAALVATGTAVGAQWRSDEASVPRISLQDLQDLIVQDEVLIIDVRARSDYQVGHIPGAISIPLGTEGRRIDELRRVTKAIVTYCT